ncbi:16S rRNA (adenine(1518)-N(6)/adenine(1519)-N(6))-dimethyltransferase RsmA [Rickettsia endosymbiont of Cardiosporidium cionae]|uniref:16S rRNA (adenine(1518)-N(6)/adenine(1519)-N(6))- dimethyltransferase RsmA n=1 Tax=Rickettsia endosymbiont of Cardiosporidium cionae TaxID=2777155 RepID=UPI00189490B1|nr:16S rRNA (adenine(1518)-N(6)/adenine(1519)-N(6))-dimethyltransferase RsmA [Rickettsia endosymbiont of Cardiosporidium cionae]KAF8818935.1 ribosomal RNA small subunit methyltransferase A [Rickettsia endosymbiont of Cardiosporidium cionae]
MLESSIKEILKKYQIIPLKKYSQNFLLDQNICDKIAFSSDIDSRTHVIEIGPAIGNLTKSILALEPHKLTTIEVDKRFTQILEIISSKYDNIQTLYSDALKIDWNLICQKNHNVTVISNLPYHISTALIIKFMYLKYPIRSLVLTLQKELAERLLSKTSTKQYGRISVIVQTLYDVRKIFDISPEAFYPIPQIHSSVLKFDAKSENSDIDLLSTLSKVTNAAFQQRRKMIQTSLSILGSQIKSVLAELNINPKIRGENLSPEDYMNIARMIHNNHML